MCNNSCTLNTNSVDRACPHVVVVVGRATHASATQSESPDQEGHGGLRRALDVEIQYKLVSTSLTRKSEVFRSAIPDWPQKKKHQ